jgi:hypothetical protein
MDQPDPRRPTAVPTFSTLVNQRIVIPSERTQYMAVDRHFLFLCMQSMVTRVHVDEAWYEQRYPDVSKAVQQGAVGRPRDHYFRFGYFENRLPYRIEVDEDYYLETNPDIADAIRNGLFDRGQEHFEAVGYKEGRLPYPGFSLALDAPPDSIV